jgi:hypothetical protein
VLTAGYVQASAGGVLSVVTEVALSDLGDYTRGDLIYGGGADWADLAHPGAANRVLQSTAAEVGWSANAVTFPTAGTVIVGSGVEHRIPYFAVGDNYTLTSEAGFTYSAASDRLSVENIYVANSGTGDIAYRGNSGGNTLTVPNNLADALSLKDDEGLTYWQAVSTDAQPIFEVNPGEANIDLRVRGDTETNLIYVDASGDAVGIGVSDPDTLLELYRVGTQLKLSGGAADYATFAVAADGALTITTVDVDGAEADIDLVPDGHVKIAGSADPYSALAKLVINGRMEIQGAVSGVNAAVQYWKNADTGKMWAFAQRSAAGTPTDGLTLVHYTGASWVNDIFNLHVNGDVGINVASALAKLHVDQHDVSGAKPVLYLDQADVSEGFVDYVGTSAPSAVGPISSWTAGNSIQGFVRVEINGAAQWMPYYDAPTS